MTHTDNKTTHSPDTKWITQGRLGGGNFVATCDTEKAANIIRVSGEMLDALKDLIALADEGAYLDLADVDSTPISQRIRAIIDRIEGQE